MIDTIVCGDCLEIMKEMESESVDLVVTSPPYDNLRDYHGYVLDVPAMVAQFMRIMKQGGVIVWVVGDATINGSETGTSFRQALMFMDAGFRLHDTMIYGKHNPTPYHHNRYNPSFEYMFVITKGRPSTFNPIQTQTQTQRKRVGTFRYPDGTLKKANCEIPQAWKPLGNIFYYNVGLDRDNINHPASFPEKLAADHIASWSNEGDLVLDPMCGSGTACKMAERLNRHWIGIDVSQTYVDIARERIRVEQAQLKLDL